MKTSRVRSILALLAVVAAAVTLAAQQPIRTGTNVVRVDVTVLDRRGAPVPSLTADDFEVREDGQPQAITSFKFVEASGEPTDDLSLDIRSPEHAKAEAARDDVRVFLVFWDEYHIEEFRSTLYARQGFERIMLEAFGPTDLVGIMDQLLPTDAIRFSRDRRALSDQIHKLKGRQRVYLPMRSIVEEEHFRLAQRFGDIEVFRGEVSRSAIKAAAAFLGTLKEGRKNLIIIGQSLGPFRDRADEFSYMTEMIRAANDSNTTIYTYDPRGLTMSSTFGSPLDTIAYESGGQPLRTNDVAQVFPRVVVKQSSAFYLLGYAKDMPEDGKFHAIKVRVKQPGLEVRARSGYWAPRAADVARAKEIAAESVRPPEIVDAFAAVTPLNARQPVDVWTGVGPFTDGRARVIMAWTPRDRADERMAPEDVSVLATSGETIVFRGTVRPTGTTFEAGPGTLQLAFSVRDKQGEIIDRVARSIDIPDPAPTSVSLTTPAVSRSRNPIELKAITSDPRPPLHAGRDFARTDRLLVQFAAQGGDGAPAVSAKLLDNRGAPLADLPARADALRGGYHIDLPLGSVARGEYVIGIEARHGEARAVAHLAFRVVK
jgi:VWFA-related protein